MKNLTVLLKSVLYRIFGTLATILISFVFTGDFVISLGIGGIEAISKILLYFVYEKLWNYFTEVIKKKRNKK